MFTTNDNNKLICNSFITKFLIKNLWKEFPDWLKSLPFIVICWAPFIKKRANYLSCIEIKGVWKTFTVLYKIYFICWSIILSPYPCSTNKHFINMECKFYWKWFTFLNILMYTACPKKPLSRLYFSKLFLNS